MRKLQGATASLFVAAAVTLGLSACGGSSSGSDEGGVLRGTFAAFPDYMDPALSYSAEGATAMRNTYLPLLTYAHAGGAAGTELIPALAKSLPAISDDGRTYTLFLRPGLKYSDGTPVRASDFAYAVERMFRLASAGTPFYTDIVGAEEFAKAKEGGIPGIETDDESGRIDDPPGRAARHLQQRAGSAVRRAAAAGHAPTKTSRRIPRRPPART